MNKNMRSIMIMAALAFVLVIAAVCQEKSADTAIDPVCGMTVVKATAKATFEYKGTTYYFCSTGCKEAFAKEPEKYLKAEAKVDEKAAPMGMMHGGKGMRMGGGMGMGHGTAMGMACGPDCPLHGADVEMALEKTKDGVTLKVTSKNAETVKAIQEHMTEHVAMMKKMKEEKDVSK